MKSFKKRQQKPGFGPLEGRPDADDVTESKPAAPGLCSLHGVR
jgi:hypothetical protein